MKKLILAALWLWASGCHLPQQSSGVKFHNHASVLPDNLPFSEAVEVGGLIYLSGQIGVVPGTLKLVDGGIEAQARQTMDNIGTVLRGLGLAMPDVIKCTVMMADIGQWASFNHVYQSYFDPPYPARSAFGSSGLALGALVEVECMAKRPSR